MRADIFKKAIKSFLSCASFFSSNADGAFGAIATLWNMPYIEGILIHLAKNFLIVNLWDLGSHLEWFLINVYAPNARSPCASLWSSLANFIMN